PPQGPPCSGWHGPAFRGQGTKCTSGLDSSTTTFGAGQVGQGEGQHTGGLSHGPGQGGRNVGGWLDEPTGMGSAIGSAASSRPPHANPQPNANAMNAGRGGRIFPFLGDIRLRGRNGPKTVRRGNQSLPSLSAFPSAPLEWPPSRGRQKPVNNATPHP